MTKQRSRIACALALLAALPAAAFAQPHGGFDLDRDVNPESAPLREPIARQQPAGHGAPAVRNPHAVRGSYGWNNGIVWLPSPLYWGGGFWGPFALAELTSTQRFGSLADPQGSIEPSYQVDADSPGAQFLQDYGLAQTPCGQPSLVVIWGPAGSAICALPNALVAAGTYKTDPAAFALVLAPL